jgi:hypothetical protein
VTRIRSISPWKHRAVAGGNTCYLQRILRQAQIPEVEVRTRRAWQHASGIRSNGERDRARKRGLAVGEGKASKGLRHWGGFKLLSENLKHGEPHDRLQDAIGLQGNQRSKPSESGGTTRAEHADGVASICRKGGFGQPGSGRRLFVSIEGRSLNESHERSLERTQLRLCEGQAGQVKKSSKERLRTSRQSWFPRVCTGWK